MNVGSLFTGIGGLDLGLERAGMTVVWQSEIDPYACRVLAKHWPTVPNLGDITKIDWENDGRDHGDGIARSLHVDLICGGYPCQPFSLAGTRNGTNDARHLWPHMRDAVRHLRPEWALLENVPGHLSLGFGRVLGDLAELGYDCEWDCIPAAAVGAPHLRYRVFVVAHTAGGRPQDQRQSGRTHPPLPVAGGDGADVPDTDSRSGVHQLGADPPGDGGTVSGEGVKRVVRRSDRRGDVPDTGRDVVRVEPVSVGRGDGQAITGHDGPNRDVADTDGTGPQGHRSEHRLREDRPQGAAGRRSDVAHTAECERPGIVRWDGSTQRPAGRGGHWAVEPDVGRVAHGIPHRVDRLRTLGNAVVPQVAELIGRRIMNAAS